jgi:hypothetical protein
MSHKSVESKPDTSRTLARGPFARAALVWVILTVISLAAMACIYLLQGQPGLARLIQAGPQSDIHLTLLSVAIAWLLVGAMVALFYFRQVNSSNVVTLTGFFCVSFLYVNILRERTVYGDVNDYINAAINLASGTPLHPRYIYPPFWAALLQFLVPLGTRAVFDVCWLLNLVSLGAFYLLLQHVLSKYGFSARLAAMATLGFMIVNVPILRTLTYGQVNLHVANLVLISLIGYPRQRFVSALALGVAVHLKASPIILALAFLLARDWRWIAWFSLCTVSIAVATVMVNGVSPYFDYLTNIQNIYTTQGISFRENSIDSFVRALSSLFNIGDKLTMTLIGAGKLLLTCACLIITGVSVKRKTFFAGEQNQAALYNAFPGLLILTVMASPLVWTHLPVILSLAYLVILRNVSSPREWLFYGLAYFLEFLAPTFDFFPWSYVRLASPLIWLGLAWSVSKRPGPSNVFMLANEWLTNIASSARIESSH